MSRSKNIRNELVIEGTRIGIWDWNVQTGETYFNERWANIIGYTISELKPLSIETWLKFAHPEDLEKSNLLIQEHFEGKTEYYDFQSRMRHKDGHWVWVHDRGKVFEWDEDGNPIRMCGSHIDITVEKLQEVNLKRALDERDILLKEVHHRVKNNLQLLLSLSRLKDQDGKISTSEIEDSISSIATAYEAIYKSDRLDKISIKKYFHQIFLTILNVGDIDYKIICDELENKIDFLIPLGLIVTELINNSLKHAFGNVKFKNIQMEIQEESNELVIEYSDNGLGYSEESLKSIKQSSSFGLSIIEGLVDQLNGNIQFFNNNGARAKIKITNPNKT
ncbi:PAS domain S-box protein [Vicingus serpentipes]|uniref:histidine kinase n=1 Tax=Vicingus serpentipes TaxID=1926625 RepID=A0A5C6RX89_9FLAO|nr:PAS domain-containing protein [Vicingus serpentipes]TXB66921.1 PAS domain S-box protein [Vicingus serpentipes]